MSRVLPLLALALLLLWPPSAVAQNFGRWWWQGELGISQTRNDSLRNGSRTTAFERQSLNLLWELNGYLGHPLLGRFHLGLDALLSEFEGGRATSEGQLGIDFGMRLLPRGRYPATLFYRRSRFDYQLSEDRLQPPVFQLPEIASAWGGEVAFRNGFLRGLRLQVQTNEIDFPEAQRDREDNQSLSWSGGSQRFRHRLRLRRSVEDYGTRDFEAENLTANLEESAQFGRFWSWRMTSSGYLRSSRLEAGPEREIENFRVSNSLYRPVRTLDRVDLQADVDWSRLDSSSAARSYSVSASYLWKMTTHWDLRPAVGYTRGSAGGLETSAPRLSVDLTWRRQRGVFDSLFSVRAGYTDIEQTQRGSSLDESRTIFGFSGSVAHGSERRLRKRVELQIDRNELRSTSEQILEEPDIEILRASLGTTDSVRSRLSLSRSRDSKSVGAWAQWSLRRVDGGPPSEEIETETLSGSVYTQLGQLRLRASAGSTEVRQPALGDQSVEFATGSAEWRPWRYLRLWALYRTDRREVRLGPDLDGERSELSAQLSIGLLRVEAKLFELTEMLPGGGERGNRGFQWSISRQHAGWLPIVSAPKRRGVIR